MSRLERLQYEYLVRRTNVKGTSLSYRYVTISSGCHWQCMMAVKGAWRPAADCEGHRDRCIDLRRLSYHTIIGQETFVPPPSQSASLIRRSFAVPTRALYIMSALAKQGQKKKNEKSLVGAPAQRSQSSRKGKRAWRKNVDIDDIEQGLEELRTEERVIG